MGSHNAYCSYSIAITMNPAIASWFERIRRDNLLDDDLEKTKLFLILSNCIAMQIMDRSVSHGGSKPGKSANVERDFEASTQRIFDDYFAENSRYNAKLFRRRFRMNRPMFLRIVDGVCAQCFLYAEGRCYRKPRNEYFTKMCCCSSCIGVWNML